MNVLVTGANGYLGPWCLQELRAAGHDLLVMDSHGRPCLSFVTPELPPAHDEDLRAVLEWADAVVHLAWYSKVGPGNDAIQDRCLAASLKLFRAVREAGGDKRVVFASSAAVYGGRSSSSAPVDEAVPPNPNCAYGRAKLFAEDYLRTRLPHSLSFRFGSLMGVGTATGRTKLELCVNSMASSAWRRGLIEVWNPESVKPLLHVRDAAALLAWAVGADATGPLNAAALSASAGELAKTVSAMVVGDGERDEVLIVTVPDGSGPRSCSLDCARLFGTAEVSGEVSWVLRSVPAAVREFRTYVPTPDCWNDPARWEVPAPAPGGSP